jgi:cation:H+ antiporter
MIFIYFLLLLIGFYSLIKSADVVIDSASSIAKQAGISTIVIGLTLVAFGTSLPELVVSFIASLKAFLDGGNADIAIGNVLGSNIANLSLILGVSAVLSPLIIDKNLIKKDIPYLLMVSTLFVMMLSFFGLENELTRIEGLILLLFFGLYVYVLSKEKRVSKDVDAPNIDVKKAWLLLLVGFIGVSLGGYAVTFASENLSISLLVDVFKMNPERVTAFVGLTIVAFGTSLPELVTAIAAIKKGKHAIAIGNVIGSNIFNILLVLGLSSTIIPLGVNVEFIMDGLIALSITLFVYLIFKWVNKPGRLFGLMLISMYISYIVYIIIRTL